MSDSGLTSQPLQHEAAFNWVYLIEFVTCGILCLFFLFYFNRFLGTVIAYAIRLYSWHKFKVYVDIEALQVSPLAGRIFFKNIRYHGDNVTVLIHGGYATWRYWLRNTKECQIFEQPRQKADPESSSDGAPDSSSDSNDNEKGGQATDNRPCRILVKVYGVEGFLYNRSPAYDWLTESVLNVDPSNQEAQKQRGFANRNEKAGYRDLHRRKAAGANISSPGVTKDTGRFNPLNRSSTSHSDGTSPSLKASPGSTCFAPPAFLRLLPIRVECNTAGLVLGNENTPSVITAKCDSAGGEFDASSSGPLDLFKILMHFDIVHPYIQMKPNVDYKRLQLTEAEAIKNLNLEQNNGFVMSGMDTELNDEKTKPSLLSKIIHPRLFKGISLHPRGSLESIAVKHVSSAWNGKLPNIERRLPGQGRWFGLRRYLEDDQHDEHDEWEPVEYASSSLLADIQGVDFKFYWDIAGRVPVLHGSHEEYSDPFDDGVNSGPPPEYGMEIRVRGGTVNYGPWADRHRIHLQNLFFPMSHADANPTPVIPAGEYRLCTIFKLVLHVDEDTVLRIPFRETSKDWRWRGRSSTMSTSDKNSNSKTKSHRKSRKRSMRRGREKGTAGADVRPFAWFDVKVRPNTTVKYVMDMFPKRFGYDNKLNVEVSGLELFSSLNHGLLWQSGGVSMQCDLSNPLAWNGIREWVFNMTIRGVDLFILRDHTFLLMDLIQDWSTGPLPEFFTFVPYRYLLNIKFESFKLFLNTNDANIVNSPDDFDDNNFVVLYGKQLDADLIIPIDRFRPTGNEITFNVASYALGFELRLPPKNTVDSLLKNKDVAQLKSVHLLGSYTSCSEVKPGLTDTLFFDITGKGLTVDFFGFFGRHLAKIRENYFGEDVHFRTLEEYQQLVRNNYDGLNSNAISVRANDLDVILDIKAEDCQLRLPAGMYNADEHVLLKLARADCDLRVGNYALELMVNSSPLEFSYTESRLDGKLFEFQGSTTQLAIDGLRFFGYRLFGQPPTEPPYVSNWDIDAGDITGECSSGFIAKLIGAAQAIALTLNDPENAVPVFHLPPIFDSTFVRFQCALVRIWCDVGQEALLLSTQDISGTFNDFGNEMFSQRLHMRVGNVTCACCDGTSIARVPGSRKRLAETHAYLNTAISFDMVGRDYKFTERKQKQQEHIYQNDKTTGRVAFLVHNTTRSQLRTAGGKSDIQPTSIPLPSLPSPLQRSNNHINFERGDSFIQQRATSNVKSYQKSMERASTPGRPALAPTISDDTRGGFTAVSFSSPFKLPHFRLDDVQIDLTDVPSLPDLKLTGSNLTAQNEDIEHEPEEESAHVSFLVDTSPGVVVYCKPRAIYCVASLIDRVLPKFPENVLDDYFFSTMTKVQGFVAARTRNASETEISIRVPFMHVRFVNEFNMGRSNDSRGSDRYDLTVSNVNVAGRNRDSTASEQNGTQALHGNVGSVTFSAQEGLFGKAREDVAFKLQINDVLLWLARTDRLSVNASLRLLETSVESKKLEYLAALIHRTVMMGGELQARFMDIFAMDAARLRFIVYHLATNSNTATAPLFLTRPSYALQSTDYHIRSRNSWKIISRLRYIYQEMSQEDKARIVTACSRNHLTLPETAERDVLNTFEEWQSWDAFHAMETFAVRALYGSTTMLEQQSEEAELPLELSVRAGSLKAIVDPSHNQSDFVLDDLALLVSITPTNTASALHLFQEQSEPKSTAIQINTTRLAVHINWEINELVDQLLTRFEQSSPDFNTIDYNTAGLDKVPKKVQVQTFHIVLGSDISLIQIDTVNLRHRITSDGLRASITGRGWTEGEEYLVVNTLICAQKSSAELFGQYKQLGSTSVSRPSLWISYQGPKPPQHRSHEELKIAGDCDSLKFESKEEILGLIEITNAVIFDEAMTVRHLLQKHSDTIIPTSQERKPVTPSGRKLNVEVALFLNTYDINVAITSELSYRTSGEIIRTSIMPDPIVDGSMQVNFDLKAQTHMMVCDLPGVPNDLTPLKIPPLNGTLKLLQQPDAIQISATVTMEFIRMEGAALYGIFSVVGSPSVISAAQAIRADGIALDTHIKNSFPELASPKKAPTTTRPIIFNLDAVVAGCAISADAPSKTPDSLPAKLTLKLGSMQIRAGNRGQDDLVLPFPEMRVDLEHIGLELHQLRDKTAHSCGSLTIRVLFTCSVEPSSGAKTKRKFKLSVVGPKVDLFAETAPTAIRVIAHLQERMAGLDLSKEKKYLRRLKDFQRIKTPQITESVGVPQDDLTSSSQFITSLALDVRKIQVTYAVRDSVIDPVTESPQDLVLSLKNINLITRSEDEARLRIEEVLLQIISRSQLPESRAANSALLPEVIFNVVNHSTEDHRNLSFRATGKALDLQLEPHFMLPVHDLERSITSSSQNLRSAAALLRSAPTSSGGIERTKILGNRRISSLTVDADFAGAVVSLQARKKEDTRRSTAAALDINHIPQYGAYGQFAKDGNATKATLRAPGIAVKVQYSDDGDTEPSLNIETRISSSNNELQPGVVPLIMQISDSVKQVVRTTEPKPASAPQQKAPSMLIDDKTLVKADPRAVLGKTRLNLGFRICKQEIAFSCRPIAKVAAKAQIEDIYVTVNSVESTENGNFFAASAMFVGLQASLQHVYSREPTFSFDIESIVLSLMNSRHLSGTSGISAILRINPTKTQINAKQLQDILLFREIWLPTEIRNASTTSTVPDDSEPQEYFVQRYRQMAASTTFPWNASVAIASLAIDLDLGQAIGKLSFRINDLWASSKKLTSSQQTLCIGIEDTSINSTGRMSGFLELERVKVRTSIAWPQKETLSRTPLIQASVGFDQLRVKASFDYQSFAVAHITGFEFIMYNARDGETDRLVAILDGDKVIAYCIASTAALTLSLIQAFERLVQETEAAYEQALQDIEKFLRRRSVIYPNIKGEAKPFTEIYRRPTESSKTPISLHTDVVVTLKSIDIGCFPSTLFDHQVLRMEASDIQARFAVQLQNSKVHSGLGLNLGQVRVALAAVPHTSMPKTLGETSVDEVIKNATSARGGVILRVPRIVSNMQTWQEEVAKVIDYIFRSTFEGKIDVGWNYSRISFIRGMWATHSRTLAARLGKPLPESAVKITAGLQPAQEAGTAEATAQSGREEQRITAEVNLPQSKYTYRALEPPIIETPQLRDMGEATPPLEWVGLHRDKLPNVTHQIVIVTLLEIAKEVEDAYTRILGSA